MGPQRLRSDRCRVQHPGRGVLPLHGRVHGHDCDDPDRRDGRTVEVEGVRRLGPVLRRPLLPDLRWLDLGRRLAQPAREQHRPRVRLRRLRRLRCGPRNGRHRRPRRCRRSRCPHREVRTRRQAAHAGGAQHPDGDAGHVHPAVRVVRVQRGVDAVGDRPALHGGGGQHRPSRRRSVPPRRCSIA